MISFPNCKINLGLSVNEKRTDGFHNIETVMIPINLCDVLEIIISPKKNQKFTMSGVDIQGKTNDNLVIKAYELLSKDYNVEPVEIHLHKVIPVGAGLGGGSSDAAHTIMILNRLFDLNLSIGQMQDYARKLGSDCAFFIKNKPVLAYDKGDMFDDIHLDIQNYNFVIIKSNDHINTELAYSWVTPNKKSYDIQELIQQPISSWKEFLVNDFEKEIVKRFPEIGLIKEKLYQLGGIYVSMSGSGSAVFGFFDKKINFSDEFLNCFVWADKILV